MLTPVFQFGEKDAGPRKTLNGDSAQDGAPAPPDAPKQQDAAPLPAAQPAQMPSVSPHSPDPAEAEPAEIDDKIKVLQAAGGLSTQPSDTEHQPAPAPEAPGEAKNSNPPLSPPEPKLGNSAKLPTSPKLEKARKLYSQTASASPTATTAMGSVPRGLRAGRLCVTELREQLFHASPPYFPDLLPSYQIKTGNVLDQPRAAFRMGGQWYNLGFSCSVDADVTKVVSFAFRVGTPLPRSEWARRGLPSN